MLQEKGCISFIFFFACLKGEEGDISILKWSWFVCSIFILHYIFNTLQIPNINLCFIYSTYFYSNIYFLNLIKEFINFSQKCKILIFPKPGLLIAIHKYRTNFKENSYLSISISISKLYFL